MFDEFLNEFSYSDEEFIHFVQLALKALTVEIDTDLMQLEGRLTQCVVKMTELNGKLRVFESRPSIFSHTADKKSIHATARHATARFPVSGIESETEPQKKSMRSSRRKKRRKDNTLQDALKTIRE